jgi:hypothetical protein
MADEPIANLRLAAEIDQKITELSPAKRELLESLLKKRKLVKPTAFKIASRPDRNCWPISFAQQRIWLIEKLETDATIYNRPFNIHIHGKLDEKILAQSLNAIVRRHEVLRSRYVSADGQPKQLINPFHSAPIDYVDLNRST